MGAIHVCDLCGKPLPLDEGRFGSDYKMYKIKERYPFGWEFRWKTIEVHEECLRKLMNSASAGGGGHA